MSDRIAKCFRKELKQEKRILKLFYQIGFLECYLQSIGSSLEEFLNTSKCIDYDLENQFYWAYNAYGKPILIRGYEDSEGEWQELNFTKEMISSFRFSLLPENKKWLTDVDADDLKEIFKGIKCNTNIQIIKHLKKCIKKYDKCKCKKIKNKLKISLIKDYEYAY